MSAEACGPFHRYAVPGSLTVLQRHLHAAPTVSQLLARASVQACHFCGFDRAVVLTVRDGMLLADGTTAIEEPACDTLRRRALASRLGLPPDSEEAEVIRRAERLTRARTPQVSELARELALDTYVLVPIVPETRVVALLVVDRAGPALEERDRAAVELFAHLLGLALERIVMRTRMGELSAEMRHMTASANALTQEAMTAPVSVNSDIGWGPVFSSAAATGGSRLSSPSQLLTPRELEIVELMAQGRSNRDIATELFLAPNTIKAHVARLLRKLGASNRAEAVGRYLTMRAGERASETGVPS